MTSQEETQGSAATEGTPLLPHAIYLFKERRSETAYKSLKLLQDQGYEIMIITRDHPKRLIEKYGLKPVALYWLTQNKMTEFETISPSEISRLSTQIIRFITGEGATKRAVIMDHLEYMVTQTNFETMIRVIHLIRDKIMLHPVVFILPLDPHSLDFKELRLIERECEIIDMKDY